jgi:hypothetical protein
MQQPLTTFHRVPRLLRSYRLSAVACVRRLANRRAYPSPAQFRAMREAEFAAYLHSTGIDRRIRSALKEREDARDRN